MVSYRALERMPELRVQVAAEPLEAFLKNEDKAIEALLRDDEDWASKAVDTYPPLPAALAYRADPAKSDAQRRYAEQLASLGYNRWSQRRLNSVAEHLGLWLQASRIGWHDVNASVVERFVHHDCGCAEGRKSGEITKTGLQKRRQGTDRINANQQKNNTDTLKQQKQQHRIIQ